MSIKDSILSVEDSNLNVKDSNLSFRDLNLNIKDWILSTTDRRSRIVNARHRVFESTDMTMGKSETLAPAIKKAYSNDTHCKFSAGASVSLVHANQS